MYGCDCDGVRREPLDGGREGEAVRASLRTIERVTGFRPPTCPWRSFYEPIVREVMEIAWTVDDGNLSAALGPDPDAVLVEAMGVYRRSLSVTRADDAQIEREERERKAAHAAAARKAGLRG